MATFDNNWFSKGSGATAWLDSKRKEYESTAARNANLSSLKEGDSNNVSDKKAATSKDDALKNMFRRAKKIVIDPLVDTVKDVSKRTANTVRAGEAAGLGLERVGYESLFGTDASYQKALNTTNAAIDAPLKRGAYGTVEDVQKGGTRLIKPIVKGGTDIAQFAAPEVRLLKGAGIVKNVAASAGTNALLGAAGSAATQYSETGKVDTKQLAKDTAVAGTIGGILRGGGEVVGAATRKLFGKEANKVVSSEPSTLAPRENTTPTLHDAETNVPRSDTKPFAGTYDDLTHSKVNALVKEASTTARPPDTVRVFQAVGKDGKTDYVFDNVDSLAAFKNANTGAEDTFKFMDVSPDQLKAGKAPGVFQVTEAPKPQPIDVNKSMNDAVDAAAHKHDQGFLKRIASAIGQHTNPLGFAREIDQKAAKRRGLDYKDLPASDSLEHNIQMKNNVDTIVNTLAREKTGTGQSFQDLAKKYQPDTPEAREFANYTAAKYDLDRRAQGRQKVLSDYSDDDLKAFITGYESRFPDAIKDLQTKNNFYQHAADELHAGGLLSDKEYADITNSSDVATPFNRIFADKEALDGGQIPGRRTGSIAKQSVIKGIKGGTEPVDASLDVVLQRVHKAVTQRIDNNIASKLRDAAENGDVDGRVFQEAGAKEAKDTARRERIQLNKEARKLGKQVTIIGRQARKIQGELDRLNKEGMNLSLSRENNDSLAGKMADPSLSQTPSETKNIVGSLLTEDPKNLQKVRDKIANREPKLAAKIDKILEKQQEIAAKKADAMDMRTLEVGLSRESTTGKAFINGVDNGSTFRVELPPKIINRLDKLSRTEVNAALKGIGVVNQVFRVAWVGALAPGFAVKSVLWDTVMGVVNSPEGWKTLAPSAVKASFKALTESDEFLQLLRKSGAGTVGSSQLGIHAKLSSESLGATRSLFTKLKFSAKNPQSALDSFDVFGGKLASLTRTRVAKAAYDRAKKSGLSEDEALATAAYEYNNIMPDFATVSPLVRQINTVIPFANASLAGTRSLAQAFKRRPVATTAKILGLGVAPAVAIAAYSMGSESGQKYYQDMMDAGNTTTLDSSLHIVLPGATKDDATGEWTGVLKIPMAPEFRSLNSQAWRRVVGMQKGKSGPSAQQTALDLFDFMTGGVRTLSNPLVDIKTVLDGKDPRTNKQLVGDDLKDLPQDEQAYATTSGAGKAVGKVLHTSPIQGDRIIGQFGVAGSAIKKGSVTGALADNTENTYTKGYGERASSAFYNTYSPLKAKRDKASREVTDLVKEGKINEAKRRASDYNGSLKGSFKSFSSKYEKSDAYNPAWDDMMNGLFISTSENSFKARAK